MMTGRMRRRTPEAACKCHGSVRRDGGLRSCKAQDEV